MNLILIDISDKKVYPIMLKNNGKSFITLHYYNNESDAILHNSSRLVYFDSAEVMKNFCESNDLTVENETVEFDFDIEISDPINYKKVLDNWNLLDTASDVLGMYFEGKRRKYNGLYDLLFCLNTPEEQAESPLSAIGDRFVNQLAKVFRKKNRVFERFELYSAEN